MTTTVARPGASAPSYDIATNRRPAQETLVGLRTMIDLVIRRNRVRLAVWFVVIVGLFAYVESYYKSVFTTQQALDDFAKIGATPSMRALTGVAAVPNTLGGAVWTKIWMTCALTLMFGIVFLVTRSGRADEETGRAELLRSRVLGIHAYSVANYLVLTALSVVTGLGVFAVSAAQGVDPDGAGITGSAIMGASICGVGLIAIGVAAVCNQLTPTARGANALASTVVGVFYVIRMSGDMNSSALTWVSPVGWAEKMDPYGPNRWWPLLPLVVVSALLVALAVVLEARRDHGAGLLPDRAGRPVAPAFWATPLGLGLRLQRGSIIGWSLVVLLAAMMFGSVVQSMSDLLDDAGDAVTNIVGGSGLDALMSMLAMMVSMVVAVFALQSVTALRADEASGILEPQLAGAVSRWRWAVGRLAIPVVGSLVMLAVGGAVMGATYGATIHDSSQTMKIMEATIAFWPAVMTLVGISVFLFGWAPRAATAVTWGLLAAVWFVAIIGTALNLPGWLLNATPFEATPRLPMESMNWAPVGIMTVVAAGLIAAGLLRFGQRDIQPD